MSPTIECPYCGLNLVEFPDHDLFHCKMTEAGRQEVQTEELEQAFRLEDTRPKEKE
jgi:hypothetical protein